MGAEKSFVDIQEVVNEIRTRVRARAQEQAATPAASEFGAADPAPSIDLSRLHRAARRMRSAQALVGQMPPRPAGLRARLGAWLVAVVRRMLFWYTPQILQFQQAAVQAVEEQESASTALSREVADLNHSVQSLQRRISSLEHELAQLRNAVQAGEARIRDVQRRLDESIGFAADRLADLRAQLKSLRIAPLAQASHPAAHFPGESCDTRGLDTLYARFVEVFRGTREDIKGRARVYLPVLAEAGVGGPDMPVLDIGCGRGEWVELLKESGIAVRGVDANPAMVARCEILGLPVTTADGIEHLKSLPAACVGAVTAFHLVEHLPFEKVIDLFDETVRVLKPGGVAILETPNPDNLLVGASTFYSDPTHRRPLPSAVLKFLAEARGFSTVEIRPLHAYPESCRLPEDPSGVGQRLNGLLYGPQDYAIIGRVLQRLTPCDS